MMVDKLGAEEWIESRAVRDLIGLTGCKHTGRQGPHLLPILTSTDVVHILRLERHFQTSRYLVASYLIEYRCRTPPYDSTKARGSWSDQT
jgi:hypothetical protein